MVVQVVRVRVVMGNGNVGKTSAERSNEAIGMGRNIVLSGCIYLRPVLMVVAVSTPFVRPFPVLCLDACPRQAGGWLDLGGHGLAQPRHSLGLFGLTFVLRPEHLPRDLEHFGQAAP